MDGQEEGGRLTSRQTGPHHGPERGLERLEGIPGTGEGSGARSKARAISNGNHARTNRARQAAAALAFCGTIFAADPSTKPRYISYREADDIPKIFVSLGFTAEVKLPPKEEIALATGASVCDATKSELCSGYFAVGFQGPVVDIKALGTEAGKRTDLRLLCKSGNEYSFIVEEVSRKAQNADLKIFVKNEDQEAQVAMVAPPKLFTSSDVAVITKERDDAQAALAEQRVKAGQIAAQAQQDELGKITGNYQMYDHKGEDFHASAVTDGIETRIRVNTSETPSLFEIRDKKLSLIQERFADGQFRVPKVLAEFELRIGKSYAKFRKS